MRGTPTFELRDTDPGHLRIVRVGVEYPPDATPDAPLPGDGAPAFLELHRNGGSITTAATTRGFDLPQPTDGDVWLFYRDEAGRTQRVQVHLDHLGCPEAYDPDYVNWDAVGLTRGDVKAWPVR